MAQKTKNSKGYSKEALTKIIRQLREKIDIYMTMPAEDIKLAISNGNRKIGRVMNVSLPPLFSCGNCDGCKHFCYDIKACLQYENVRNARARNLAILTLDRGLYFRLIDNAISRRRKNKYFRWHVAGDIVDIDYLDNMVQIAARHPDWIFWTYTKMYWIVNSWIDQNGPLPENLHIMFSEWKGMPIINPHNMPVFGVIMPGEETPNTFLCPGNCDICKQAGRGCIAGETTYNHLH